MAGNETGSRRHDVRASDQPGDVRGLLGRGSNGIQAPTSSQALSVKIVLGTPTETMDLGRPDQMINMDGRVVEVPNERYWSRVQEASR